MYSIEKWLLAWYWALGDRVLRFYQDAHQASGRHHEVKLFPSRLLGGQVTVRQDIQCDTLLKDITSHLCVQSSLAGRDKACHRSLFSPDDIWKSFVVVVVVF